VKDVKIKCSKCGVWKLRNKESLERVIKKEGKNFSNWLKTYKCQDCRENNIKEKLKGLLDKDSEKLIR
jgi:hypothetical protein